MVTRTPVKPKTVSGGLFNNHTVPTTLREIGSAETDRAIVRAALVREGAADLMEALGL